MNIFLPLIEILVDENTINNDMPIVYVTLEFALMLRVGDVLFFPPYKETQPRWVEKMDDSEQQLYDRAITLTQRNILSDSIQFYAKRD